VKGYQWSCDLTSRSILITAAVIAVIIVTIVYYFSGPASISPQTTPESKPTTHETQQETPTTPEAKKETPPTMVDGSALYKENCEGCHGARGVGGIAPALSSNVDKSIIENGNTEKGMPSFKDKLTPEEITAIITYLERSQLTH
jgi:mono/diheme cytochrome c family protein